MILQRQQRITASGSSWLQSTRIVHRKRRPTSNVDSMTVLRGRHGGTGSKYVAFRGRRRAIPSLLVRSKCGAPGPLFYARADSSNVSDLEAERLSSATTTGPR